MRHMDRVNVLTQSGVVANKRTPSLWTYAQDSFDAYEKDMKESDQAGYDRAIRDVVAWLHYNEGNCDSVVRNALQSAIYFIKKGAAIGFADKETE